MAKLKSINPHDGSVVGSVKISTKSEVEEAVAKARLGFLSWQEVPLQKRAKILLKTASLLVKNQKKLAEMITEEMGKPIGEAMDEVKNTAEEMEWLAEKAVEVLTDEVIEPKLPQTKLNQMAKLKEQDAIDYLVNKKMNQVEVVRYDPIGVIALIKPWNYPVETVAVSLVPALMAGNSVILKPSEYVSLVTDELIKLFWLAGVPKEVLQVVYGRGQVGAMLVETEVDMISFTGSSKVGREIAEKCGKMMKKCVLELGGSSPAIVCRDADLDLAVDKIVSQRFSNCGQICSATKRVYVDRRVAKVFIEKLVKKVKEIKVGDPKDKKNTMGPLVSVSQLKNLQSQVTRAVVQSGRIITGGRRMRDEKHLGGCYHEPTVMVYVRNTMDIMQEEVFGPVLPVSEVENFEEALKRANDNPYGLTAMVFTKSKKIAMKALKRLEAGSITINDNNEWNVKASWSGMKNSGFGVELGKHGIWEYTQIKHIAVDL